MQKRKAVWPWVVLGVVAVGGIGGWLFQDDLRRLPSPGKVSPGGNTQVAAPAAAPSQIAAAPVAASPRYPLHSTDAADVALPVLADSDAQVMQMLGGMFPDGLLALRVPGHLIQRGVVHIDNLTQPSLPAAAMALRPVAGSPLLQADGQGGEQLAAANAARYAPYVDAFTGVDAQRLAQTYRRLYPLIQQAWREVGHPDGHFNDRLVAVIDHLLLTPEPPVAPSLALDERGKYRFVDPDLQARSVGQKALLRLEVAQARAVKQQLRELRTALTGG